MAASLYSCMVMVLGLILGFLRVRLMAASEFSCLSTPFTSFKTVSEKFINYVYVNVVVNVEGD